MKKCSKCKKNKNNNEYYPDETSPDGLRYYCNDCDSETSKKNYQKNKEKIKRQRKEYYNKNKEKELKRMKKCYQKNKEKMIRRVMEYYKKNKEEIKQKRKIYRKEYYSRPEVKEHREKTREEYNSRPEIKKHKTEYAKERRHNPELKKYFKEKWAQDRKRRNDKCKNIILMSNPFPPEIKVDFHHLLNDFYNPHSKLFFMWAIPRITHHYVGGSKNNREHWKHNTKWIKKLYCIDIKKILSGY